MTRDYGWKDWSVDRILSSAIETVDEAKSEFAASTTSRLDDFSLWLGDELGSLALEISSDIDKQKAMQVN